MIYLTDKGGENSYEKNDSWTFFWTNKLLEISNLHDRCNWLWPRWQKLFQNTKKKLNFEVLEKNPTSNSSRNKSSDSSEKRLKFLVNER